MLLLLIPLALPSCMCFARSRREVFKRARPPGGGDGDGGRPITGLQAAAGSDDAGTRANRTAARPNKRLPHLLDVGRLLQLVATGNASGHHRSGGGGGGSNESHQQPVMSRHIDASMAEVVALQTFDGDVSWIEAKFVNDSHGGSRRRHHRTRPYSVEERLALFIPVVAFMLPFLIWLCCMVICIARASARGPY